MKHYPHLFFILLSICIISCNKCSHDKSKPIVLVAKPEQVNEEVSELIKQKLNSTGTSKVLIIAHDSLFATKLIIEFYKKNNFIVT